MPAATTPLHVGAPWVDPEVVFRALYADAGDVFWLDSGADAVSGLSYLGASERTLSGSAVPPEVARIELGRASARPAGAPTLTSGWVGWVSYEAACRMLGMPDDDVEHAAAAAPAVVLLHASRMLVFDHPARTLELRAASHTDDDRAWIEKTLSALAALRPTATSPAPIETRALARTARWRHDDAAYLALIARCRESIARGDAYQLCLTNTATVDGVDLGDAASLYLRLRRSSPAHHGGFVRAAGAALLSSSPEQFVRVADDGVLTTKPIKGTRPRGETPERDARQAAELAADPKERAENVMIVDLLRNDVSRLARPGSVRVPELLAVESYRHVHQLVSTIEARMRAGLTVADLLGAILPPGSMTGTPKQSAVQILRELERGPRGVYSGAFGFIDDGGAVDLAVVIRSIVIAGGRATIGSGGGITSDSVPERELAEVALKAAPLLDAVGASGAGG
ncbi:aminodeoxychorismate synthase component I [Cnuibacter sp. UC19_7]|uniref:aminodeoxychorismate synthase component I n=1 Tax=Cnuibacter sp. UC19_7 TaxID=3350166 RepID=UPI003670E53D